MARIIPPEILAVDGACRHRVRIQFYPFWGGNIKKSRPKRNRQEIETPRPARPRPRRRPRSWARAWQGGQRARSGTSPASIRPTSRRSSRSSSSPAAASHRSRWPSACWSCCVGAASATEPSADHSLTPSRHWARQGRVGRRRSECRRRAWRTRRSPHRRNPRDWSPARGPPLVIGAFCRSPRLRAETANRPESSRPPTAHQSETAGPARHGPSKNATGTDGVGPGGVHDLADHRGIG